MSIPSDSAQLESELLLRFGISEIHLGLAFVGAARAAYGRGQFVFGDEARERAEELLAKVKLLSPKISKDESDALSADVAKLQDSLDRLLRDVDVLRKSPS